MRKKSILIIICLLIVIGFSVFSEDKIITLYIDQIKVDTSEPVLEIDDVIMVPMISTFNSLGAQIYENDIIISYYLNTFVKMDIENNYFSINGKKFKLNNQYEYRNEVLYVPVEFLMKSFDLTKEQKEDNQLYLKANTVIQYRNIDAIQYKQISFEEDGVRFSVPLDWSRLSDHTYGYDSSYGRISVNFSSRMLNNNIDTDLVINTYKEHLLMEYGSNAKIVESKQQIYNYLTSNVLYIELDVNGILMKRVVHFVKSEDQVYIIEFVYPTAISEHYILNVVNNILNSFYIDDISFDANSEHYIETTAAMDLNLVLSSQIYSNMTLNGAFILEGYFNTDQTIESITVTVSRNDSDLDFNVPVQNNSFLADIYTPFGLGKHNVKVSVTSQEEKITFDQDTDQIIHAQQSLDLLRFSVVNLSEESIRYNIPTKMVQSDAEYITSMSNLITYKFHTNYSKAKAVYDFIVSDIEVLALNDMNYSALDVYENFKGTKKEIAYYITALLRAQNIPTRIVEGTSDFSRHIWVEAYLNGGWMIIDPVGDSTYIEILTSGELDDLHPGFNSKRTIYDHRYYSHRILDY